MRTEEELPWKGPTNGLTRSFEWLHLLTEEYRFEEFLGGNPWKMSLAKGEPTWTLRNEEEWISTWWRF